MPNNIYFLYAALFVVILGAGYWLARLGKPYNVAIQTIHKLVGVGAFVYLVYSTIQLNKVAPLNCGQMGALIICSVFFISLIATGGMLATEKEFPGVVLKTHKVAPYLTVVSTGISLYLLSSGQL